MSDKISIAMTTYNGGKYLREQLDSLYTQTRIPDEIVVCDDHSKDSTTQILEEYHRKYGLRYFINETNLGVNKNGSSLNPKSPIGVLISNDGH